MSATDNLVDRLVEALRRLPGVGPKSAQRIALHLLERDRDGARLLSEALRAAADGVRHCSQCRDLCDGELCERCANPRRDRSLLCVVEGPADVRSIEQTAGYDGLYFVLMGHLSPIDGIGPAELGLDQLSRRLAGGEVKEVILATDTTPEGEATAHYLAELARAAGVRASRIAYGVPLGGDLEYVDAGTLAHAIAWRQQV